MQPVWVWKTCSRMLPGVFAWTPCDTAKRLVRLTLLLLAGLGTVSAGAGQGAPRADFEVLCYHEVRDDVHGDLDRDNLAVGTDRLVAHFEWLRGNGYHPVSVDDILAARRGGKPLPEKAVLLTFDDGYESFYSRIFPLLKLYHYPAVMALVTSWLEVPPGGKVHYGDTAIKKREEFLTWTQIRQMQASGLVEFASHSHDLHHGIQGNPQGNLQQAAITHGYNPATGRYESDAAYRRRIGRDLARSARIMRKHLGRAPRVLVWPYGAYNSETLALAARAGMSITLTLEDDRPPQLTNLSTVGRHLMEYNPALDELASMLRRVPDRTPLRAAHVDLDYVYDEDPVQQKRNFDQLLERIKKLRITTVFLQAFADPDGDGTAEALYFPNRYLPMRADLFNRVAWQLTTRAGVRVYAWMPVMSFDLADQELAARLQVKLAPGAEPEPGQYRRLSPFAAKAREIIGDIYSDLGRYTHVAGILFHDDALLTDYEDARPEALATYRQWGLPDDLEQLRNDDALRLEWGQRKARFVTDFTLELAERVRHWRPGIRTARNLYAPVIMQPESTAWFAQDYPDMLRAYDYVAVMAMPYMEQAPNGQQWLAQLARAVRAVPGGKEHTIMELQAVNWRENRRIPMVEFAGWVQTLRNLGMRHFAWYPDNFVDNYPPLVPTRALVSASDYPYALPR